MAKAVLENAGAEEGSIDHASPQPAQNHQNNTTEVENGTKKFESLLKRPDDLMKKTSSDDTIVPVKNP